VTSYKINKACHSSGPFGLQSYSPSIVTVAISYLSAEEVEVVEVVKIS